jgi:hypothetical protein
MSYPPDDDADKGLWDDDDKFFSGGEDIEYSNEDVLEEENETDPPLENSGESSGSFAEEESPYVEGLFAGDEGTFPVDLRRVLVNLLKGPFIDGRDEKDLWSTLVRDEEAVKRWLGEVFLELVVDKEAKIAFARQHEVFEFKVPVLLRRNKLNFMESVIVMFLRRKLTQSGFKGERAVVSSKEILLWLEFFNNKKRNDPSTYEKQVKSAIKKIQDRYKLLRKLPGVGLRYEISPALKLILEPEDIATLTKVYKELLKRKSPDEASDGEEGKPEEEAFDTDDDSSTGEFSEEGEADDFSDDLFSKEGFFESEDDSENDKDPFAFADDYDDSDDDDEIDGDDDDDDN